MKSFCIALILLLFGGVFGFHHFYLGRIRHGILYMFTFGCYGFGALYDFMRLRHYVRWANFDKDFKEEYLAKIRRDPEPSLSVGRMMTLMCLPQAFGTVVRYALPEELLNPYVHTALTSLIMPCAEAFVVWFVGNIGEYEGNFKDALRGAFYVFPLYLFSATNTTADLICALVAQYFFRKNWRYRLKPEPSRPFLYNVGIVLFFFTVFSLLFVSMLMFSCEIEKDGEQIKCRDALRRFFTSPLWQDILTSLRSIKNSIAEGGWENFRNTLVGLMDPTGELHAYRVLGVDGKTSDDDIRKAYRQLSKQYHPDKNLHKNTAEAEEAEYKFMEVQEAFDILQLRRSKQAESGSD
ncbi:dnaJ homolog subfamily C member 22 [Galendromus occidentalis]|uniref:DnaJ homolog subfamily C member 22 n=1 Tax=Galendromus occidentalis TaxID=34638 RepID=A0AAJ6QWS8_9ACAR|nr:dnaJ homolog subfamily C member 22 [Galendromus occidentalis]